MIATGLLLILAGVWLLTQTLVGDLPGRILSLRRKVGSTTNSEAA